jgi:hypothetical protein
MTLKTPIEPEGPKQNSGICLLHEPRRQLKIFFLNKKNPAEKVCNVYVVHERIRATNHYLHGRKINGTGPVARHEGGQHGTFT